MADELTTAPTTFDAIPKRPKTPKLHLKSLFGWKRISSQNSASPLNAGSSTISSPISATSSLDTRLHRLTRMATLEGMLRSETGADRPKTASAKVVVDTLSLSQTLTMGLIHTSLRVPISTPLAEQPGTEVPQSMGQVRKLFVLDKDGRILQYGLEGSTARLPEQVLQLTGYSRVCQTTSVEGEPWVLEVCAFCSSVADSDVIGMASRWPRRSRFHISSANAAERLLLIYDSSNIMSSWLSIINQQITAQTDVQMRPTSSGHEQPNTQRPPLRQAASDHIITSSALLRSSRSTSALQSFSKGSVEEAREEYIELTSKQNYGSSTTLSTTASALPPAAPMHRLRGSESGSMLTFGTNSFDDSTIPNTPQHEYFTSVFGMSTDPSANDQHRLVAKTCSTPLTLPQVALSTNKALPKLPIELERLTGLADLDTPKPATQDMSSSHMPGETEPVDTSDRASANATLSVGDYSQPSPSQALSPGKPDMTQQVNVAKQIKHDGRQSRHPARSSKSMYSLFPKNLSAESSTEASESMESSVVLTETETVDASLLSDDGLDGVLVAKREVQNYQAIKSRDNKRPAPINLFVAAGGSYEQAERSPAVTDRMIATNFGTTLLSSSLPSPLSPTPGSTPGTGSLQFDTSIFDKTLAAAIALNEEQNAVSPFAPSDSPRLLMQPENRGRRQPLITTSEPLSPPPSGPLPAIPKREESRRGSRSSSKKESSSRRSSRSASSRQHGVSGGNAPPSSFVRPTTADGRQKRASAGPTGTETQGAATFGIRSSPARSDGVPSAAALPAAVPALPIGLYGIASAVPQSSRPAPCERWSSDKSSFSSLAHFPVTDTPFGTPASNLTSFESATAENGPTGLIQQVAVWPTAF